MARYIKYIVIHCSATKEGQRVTEADIEQWHSKRFKRIGGKHIGYHILIYADGTIVHTKKIEYTGQHVAGNNANSIGICYIGGLDKNGKARDTRTPRQKKALVKVLTDLKRDYPHAVICGHRDLSPDLNGNGIIEPQEYMKDCPCFNAIDEYKNI
jgi:N-acetyl-anhydromuramyl-L-alanine amidase AmpD